MKNHQFCNFFRKKIEYRSLKKHSMSLLKYDQNFCDIVRLDLLIDLVYILSNSASGTTIVARREKR